MSVLVYRYGLLAPTESAALVEDLMRRAHRYRNALVEIERGRRAAMRALVSSDPRGASLEAAATVADAEVERLAREIKAARAAARARVDTAALRAPLKTARAAKSDAVRALREWRAEMRPAREAEEERINETAAGLRRNARAYSGLKHCWGSYQAAEAAADKSHGDLPLYDGHEPNDPRFVRWTGDGSVSVHLQGEPVMVEQVLEGRSAWVRLELDEPRGGSGRRARWRYGSLALRVGAEGRDPVWARWPIVFDRPLPDGARLTWATVHRRMIGPRAEWYATLTLDVSDTEHAVSPASANHGRAIALDVGWRLIAGEGGARELRVAVSADDKGHLEELRLSERDLGALTKADEIRSTRDQNFNAARASLVAWLGSTSAEVPSWLAAATRTLDQWRSPARLAALVLRWRSARFAGDDAIVGREATAEEIATARREGRPTPHGVGLEGWRYHDRHLWAWESSQRESGQRRRKDLYRCFAKRLAATYETLVLERFDLRKMQRHAEVGSDEDKRENATARLDQRLACVSELRGCLVEAFGCAMWKGGGTVAARTRRGLDSHGMPRVAIVDGAYSTRTCADCGYVQTFDAAALVHHACRNCGVVWDQDENAARVLLDRWRERSGGDGGPGGARDGENAGGVEAKRESKWARKAREKREREAQKGGSRKASADAAE